jgi:hypothetical protein
MLVVGTEVESYYFARFFCYPHEIHKFHSPLPTLSLVKDFLFRRVFCSCKFKNF